MTREELLQKLKNVPFRAVATVATMDMGLQYDYVSAEGAGTGFGGMGVWPAYRFQPIASKDWLRIRKILESDCDEMTLTDLGATDLKIFAEDILENYYGNIFRDICLKDMFKGLLDLPVELTSEFYSLFDMGDSGYEGHRPLFFDTEDEFLDAFKDQYCSYFDSWDNMNPEELENWLKRIEDGEIPLNFPYLHYPEELEEE